MSKKSKRKVVLITGAHGDIGRSLCIKFNQLGYSIAAVDVKSLELKKWPKKLIKSKYFLNLLLDVTNSKQVTKTIMRIKENFGPIWSYIVE